MGRREAKKQLKRERMLREGLRLFLEHGYERASVEQIAQASEVARGTFYLYFEDKKTLFAALMEGWLSTVMGLFEDVQRRLEQVETPEEAWQVYRDMGTGLAWVGLANRDEILLVFRESRTSTEAGEYLREKELEIIDAGVAFTEVAMERGLVNATNARVTVLVVLGAIERLFYEVLIGTELGDPQETAELVVGMFESALDVRPADRS